MIALQSELLHSGAKLKTPGEEEQGVVGSKEKEERPENDIERSGNIWRRLRKEEEEVSMKRQKRRRRKRMNRMMMGQMQKIP